MKNFTGRTQASPGSLIWSVSNIFPTLFSNKVEYFPPSAICLYIYSLRIIFASFFPTAFAKFTFTYRHILPFWLPISLRSFPYLPFYFPCFLFFYFPFLFFPPHGFDHQYCIVQCTTIHPWCLFWDSLQAERCTAWEGEVEEVGEWKAVYLRESRNRPEMINLLAEPKFAVATGCRFSELQQSKTLVTSCYETDN